MLYEKPPVGFKSTSHVVSCYIKKGEKYLFLKRNDSFKNTWGPPAGKVENGELLTEAVRREVREETGLELGRINHVGDYYVSREKNFIYSIFTAVTSISSPIKLSSEHSEYIWASYSELLQLPLMPDEEPCLDILKRINFIK